MSRQNTAAGLSAAGNAQDRRAESAFRRALLLDPRNAEAHVGLARIAARSNREQTAMDHYRSAVKCAPCNGAYAVEFADLLAKQAEVSIDRRSMGDAALRAYRHARSIIRGDADLTLRHGLCAREHGHYEESITCLRDAVGLSPKNVEFRLELARTYDMIGDRQAAARIRLDARRIESVTQGEDIAAVADDE